ncbi:hypothetical protein TanjilG_27929 [Lupinus angustifolius]|uniref:Cyclin-dependent kinase inhibitor domain-containing protein n=1 Tax=Lupinus angustifolius TaxID=3871 RepID=A0A4P1RGP7_LUPAN|nr:PREDICTED: cyclin-dependent kinase inhibitor 7-like [Lupinus angustifolius]OIW10178.1 hypothetical protein TanjilG_27929 [Lupinus angustifolius]
MKASDSKLCDAMVEDAPSNVSKKRKITSSSSEKSVDSSGTVVSGEFRLDRSPLSSCSSTLQADEGHVFKKLNTTPLDPEIQSNCFETVDSTHLNFKPVSLLSEFSGDSEETMTPSVKMAPKEEIEEFLTMAEKYEQKRFAMKYNFDIATDTPMEGRYEWVRLN